MTNKTYKTEEIFSVDPNDPTKTIMNIPEEILKEYNWTEGTKIKVSIGDQGTIILEDVKD